MHDAGRLLPGAGSGLAAVMLSLPYPPSVNHYYRNVRGRTLISAEGRKYRQAAWDECRQQRVHSFGRKAVRVLIDAWMPDNRRRDLDNVLKATCDAIQHARILEDDSQIVDLHIRRAGIDREAPRVEITMEVA